ncbi:hypothetical protein HMPREF1492_0454 [Atopobium sp. BS2]|nr:hypothetical protein HMPREF1492_0454 [Atopobium sp. BS2]
MGHGSTPVARYRRTNKALLVIWREGLLNHIGLASDGGTAKDKL